MRIPDPYLLQDYDKLYERCTDKLKSCLLLHKYFFETPHAALATYFAVEKQQSGVRKKVSVLLAGTSTLVWY